jgi:hypothetical protein
MREVVGVQLQGPIYEDWFMVKGELTGKPVS